jgi:hypothetical protein
MFALLSNLFHTNDDTHAHDAYFGDSADLADLERRMRRVDEEDHAYSLHFCGSIAHDHNKF